MTCANRDSDGIYQITGKRCPTVDKGCPRYKESEDEKKM